MNSLLIFLFYLCVYEVTTTENGRCFKDLSNGIREWHCCDNQEEIDGRCSDCLNGFRSDEGEKCYPCLKGTYGRKCGDVCRCKAYQICNHIRGCLNYSEVVSVSSKTSNETEPRTVTGNETERIFNTEMMMMVYITCTAVLTLALILSMILFRYYWKKRHQANAFFNKASYSAGQEKDEVVISNGIYDYIDESEICQRDIEHIVKEKRKSNESSDSNDTNILLGDGYLNPYQPIVSVNDDHGYCGKEITQGSPPHINHDDNIEVEGTSAIDIDACEDNLATEQESRC